MSEWNATDYNAHSRLQESLAEQHLSWVPLEGDERLLDVGCGDGKITAAISKKLPRGSAHGVDPSRVMIAFARNHYDSAKWPNLTFEVADVRSLPFDAEFDRVVSFNALHWVHEGAAALASMRKALKVGGRAFLEFVPAGNTLCTDYLLGELWRRPRWVGHFADFRDPFAHFTPDEYRAMAEAAGFAVERIQIENSSWDFGSRDGFLGFLRTTAYDWTNRLPEAERPAFLEDALNLYAERNGTDSVLRFLQMEVVLRAASPR